MPRKRRKKKGKKESIKFFTPSPVKSQVTAVLKIVIIGKKGVGVSTFLNNHTKNLFSDSVLIKLPMNIYYIIKKQITKEESKEVIIENIHNLYKLIEGVFRNRIQKIENDPNKSLNSYFLVKLDWEDLREIWRKEIPSAIMTMCLNNNRLFLGLKNGILQIWDFEKIDLIKSFNLFKSTVTVIEMKDDKMIAASQTGDVALISQDGTVQWKTKLSEDKIIGIHDFHNKIMLIDTKGNLYEINLSSDILLKSDKWNVISVKDPALVSNIIDFHNWFIVTGYGGIWGFWSKDFEKIYHLYMDDPLIRVLHQHPIGFISGDDEGVIRFWKLGKGKIRSRGFIGREYLEVPSQEV